jgi:broad specificity phosphatase PhoE
LKGGAQTLSRMQRHQQQRPRRVAHIFLRHGEKLHANAAPRVAHSFDPPLVRLPPDSVASQVSAFADVWSVAQVFVSPFLRTRQTATALFPKHTHVTAPDVAEFLGNHAAPAAPTKRLFDEKTRQIGGLPPWGEQWHRMVARAQRHAARVVAAPASTATVTHGVIIAEIFRWIVRSPPPVFAENDGFFVVLEIAGAGGGSRLVRYARVSQQQQRAAPAMPPPQQFFSSRSTASLPTPPSTTDGGDPRRFSQLALLSRQGDGSRASLPSAVCDDDPLLLLCETSTRSVSPSCARTL